MEVFSHNKIINNKNSFYDKTKREHEHTQKIIRLLLLSFT